MNKTYEMELPLQEEDNTVKHKFTFIDLFAGIGGIRRGMEEAGGHCVFASEWDTKACATYKENFGHLPEGDITNIASATIPDHDILTGGFPCQAFSIAGLRKGLNDPRGNLFLEIVRILKDKQPKAFLLENVKNLLSHDKGQAYIFIKEKLAEVGYGVTEKVLNASTHGNVPQNRERVFIIGIRKDITNVNNFCFPNPIKRATKIEDILDTTTKKDARYYYIASKGDIAQKVLKEAVNKNTFYQWRRVYVRTNKTGVCPTLTANMGTGGHNVPIICDDYGVRKITPEESLKLQGFPNSQIFPEGTADTTKYKQVGNSVCVPVVARVAKNLAGYLHKKKAI